MYLSRRIDDKEIQLKRQNKIFFQISGAGHEAVLVAAGMVLQARPRLVLRLLPRPRPDAAARHDARSRCCSPPRAPRTTPTPAGARCPRTGAIAELNVVTKSSPTGTQFLQAVGCAEAGVYAGRRPARSRRDLPDDEIVYCSTGEGTTSEGEFWESLNTACNRKLPVLYLVEDNGYAISVPVEVQTAGGSISKLVRSFPDLLVREVDGCDPLASLAVLREAVAWCRARRGPGARPRPA